MWYLRQLILATCPLLGQGHVPIGGNILVSLYLEPLVLTDAGGGTTFLYSNGGIGRRIRFKL